MREHWKIFSNNMAQSKKLILFRIVIPEEAKDSHSFIITISMMPYKPRKKLMIP
jgi:hypothetical protein